MKKLFHKLGSLPLGRKLMIYAALFLCVFFCICAVLLANLNNLSAEYSSINRVYSRLDAGNASMREVHQLVSDMISYVSDERILEFNGRMQALKVYFAEIDVPVNSHETFYLRRDMMHMLDVYEAKSADLIAFIRGRDYAQLSETYTRLSGIVDNIVKVSDRLTVQLYGEAELISARISRQILLFNICLPAFAVLMVLYCLVLLRQMNRRFIGPIYQLTGMAQHISEGKFPDEKLVFEEDSDFNILSETMYSMSTTIQENIEEINKRARIMQELNAQQIENLRIKSMYNQLELRRLQEQINPHFLFNCMTTLHHTAYIEGAPQTCEICSTMASLLRYNFRQCDTSVTLARELENLADFIYIQGIRFGNRIAVSTDIEPGLTEVEMPRMILQPIVENCYSHGLGDISSGGVIRISIVSGEDCVEVSVHDNGKGMSEQRLAEMNALFADQNTDISSHAHIGMLNVVKRLQGYYGRQDVIRIQNEDGLRVTIRLFLRKGEESYGG